MPMIKTLRNSLTFFMLAIASGTMPFVTTAGCDTASGAFNFFRDDDDYYDDGYVDVIVEDDYYYYDDCEIYDDCY